MVGEPATGFEDPDAIPLLGQPKRGDAAPKPEPMISTS
ncbi:cholesterol oxidase [Mycobacterium xenopi 3993]|nr:cholesterol oxidase [Mycobacterium xenopi 3993]